MGASSVYLRKLSALAKINGIDDASSVVADVTSRLRDEFGDRLETADVNQLTQVLTQYAARPGDHKTQGAVKLLDVLISSMKDTASQSDANPSSDASARSQRATAARDTSSQTVSTLSESATRLVFTAAGGVEPANYQSIARNESWNTKSCRVSHAGEGDFVALLGLEEMELKRCDGSQTAPRKIKVPGNMHEASHQCLSRDGKTLVALVGGAITKWDLTADRPKAQKLDHDGPAYYSMVLHPSGDFAVALNMEGVHFVDLASGDLIEHSIANASSQSGLVMSGDGRHLAIVTEGGEKLRLFDLTEREELPAPTFSASLDFADAAMSFDGKTLVAVDRYGYLQRWNKEGGAFGEGLSHPDRAQLVAVAISGDGKVCATRSINNRVCIWDVASGKLLGGPIRLPAMPKELPPMTPAFLSFSRDGRRLTWGGPAGGGGLIEF